MSWWLEALAVFFAIVLAFAGGAGLLPANPAHSERDRVIGAWTFLILAAMFGAFAVAV